MVEKVEAYLTKYDKRICRTQEEAEKAEKIEEKAAFCARVQELADKNKSCTYPSNKQHRDAAYFVYDNPECFLQALQEFGLLEEILKEIQVTTND
jgi:hypothetical protein